MLGIANLPTVIFSNSEQQSDMQRCVKAGANAYLIKPFDFGEFEKVIFSTFNFWCLFNVSGSL